jgi:enoyl reductase
MTTWAASDWAPPPCWYEPEFTPAQFADYINGHYTSEHAAWATMAAQYGSGGYHKGEKGAWYELVVPDLSEADECAALDPWKWIPPGSPATADAPTVDPETLAGLAFDRTILPEPRVALRPAAQNQLVNLDTEVTFERALRKVWVTARLDNADFGMHVAATTTAVPVRLAVDAGTEYADPRTCTYDLAESGGTYRVDPKSTACKVTYRKASPSGGYLMRASVVWQVTWTPSADPNGPVTDPALPNGRSSTPLRITVRENQTLNR